MKETHSLNHAYDLMNRQTGVVVPVYLPQSVDTTRGGTLLRDNVRSYLRQISEPNRLCLAVDGEDNGGDRARRMASEFGISVVTAPENRGKLHSAANGVRYLLENCDLDYVAVVDQDGDHFANELVSFLRAASGISESLGIDRVMVLGRRLSRHRPMGLLRGELEELADRVLLDALHYHAVRTNNPLRMEYANLFDEFPDFHSGYKLFSRQSAVDAFLGRAPLPDVSETCHYRHACEAVMTVECLLAGGYLGVVNRSTLNQQPITTFGLYDRCQLIADKLIWPCKRLEIPVTFVRQFLANHIPRLLLSTMIPDGREELQEIHRLTLQAFGEEPKKADSCLFQPLFV
jgi:hypothetical protein